jgi:hypothetical protein
LIALKGGAGRAADHRYKHRGTVAMNNRRVVLCHPLRTAIEML